MSKLATKKRINISVSDEINHILSRLACRDNVPVATKTLELLKEAIEIEEDALLDNIAKVRDVKKSKYFSHTQAWK